MEVKDLVKMFKHIPKHAKVGRISFLILDVDKGQVYEKNYCCPLGIPAERKYGEENDKEG